MTMGVVIYLRIILKGGSIQTTNKIIKLQYIIELITSKIVVALLCTQLIVYQQL